MEIKTLTIQIHISVLEGQEMPDEDTICDKVTDYLYDFIIDDAAIIDMVHITEIDGENTDQ